jgi:hypothetical protein
MNNNTLTEAETENLESEIKKFLSESAEFDGVSELPEDIEYRILDRQLPENSGDLRVDVKDPLKQGTHHLTFERKDESWQFSSAQYTNDAD